MRSFAAAILVLTTTAFAQGFTSPAGYIATEGSSNHDYILFKYDDLRWQQLDQTNMGLTPSLVSRVSWRRDGTSAADPTWIARTIDMEVVLSNAVMPGAISETFDANYSGPPTSVFASRPVNLPDWTAQPASAPAPFNFNLTLDAPWLHTGLEPFLWELRITNNISASDYGNDFQSTPGSTSSSNSGAAIGTGCVATGRTAAMSLTGTAKNQFTRFRLAYAVTNAPATTPVWLNVDFVNSNFAIPGLCTNVIAAPTINATIGISDATGAVPSFSLENLPFSQSTVGATLYAQALALDFGLGALPIALSNGRSLTFPATPANAAPVTRIYEYRLANGTMRAASVWTGGIVALFD